MYVLATEAFPASIRSMAFGLCASCARVGSIFVPSLATLLPLYASSLVSATLALAAAAAAHVS